MKRSTLFNNFIFNKQISKKKLSLTGFAILFLVSLLFVFSKQAECEQLNDARLLFYSGNSLYSEEKFKEAIADYEEILSLGFESGQLYYNLGNAYFKSGSLGKAILNYIRAQRLIPKDADLKSNLDYAQSLIKSRMIVPERRWLTRIFFALADSFSLNTVTVISVILYFVLSGSVIFLIITRRTRKILAYTSGVVSVFLIISVSIFFEQFYKTVIRKEAVVIVQSSDSKFEPFNDATTFFTLNEGESIMVIVSKGDWIKVRRIDGKRGWIKKSDIELI